MTRFIFMSVGVLVGACAALSCAHRTVPCRHPVAVVVASRSIERLDVRRQYGHLHRARNDGQA